MISNSSQSPGRASVFRKLFSRIRLENPFIDQLNISEELNKMPLGKVAWVTMLVIFYIFFQHNMESLTRKLERAEIDMKEIRATFISHKSRYMFNSKHSEVSKKLVNRGMGLNVEPPVKIIIEE